jgi:hypothetical protein
MDFMLCEPPSAGCADLAAEGSAGEAVTDAVFECGLAAERSDEVEEDDAIL